MFAAEDERWWAIVGLLVLVGALCFLEFSSPYYFCQDDNLVVSMPSYLFACRSVWEGKVPEYSPYNFVGCPLLSRGMGESYPPLYLSYAVARYILRDECATMDVLAIAALIVAYVTMYVLMRRAGMRGMVACVGALTYTLSGCVLVMGRSWVYFLSGAALSALLALAADRLRDGPVTWRWPIGVGALIGLYYHVGFPQLWVYGVGFFCLHVIGLAVAKVVPWRRALQAIPAVLIGIAIALPLFYPQWRLASDLPVEEAYGEGVGSHLPAFFLPYPLYKGSLPNNWGDGVDMIYGGHFFYCGSLLTILFLGAIVDWVGQAAGRFPKRRGSHVWTFCALVAFVLCLGHVGLLWTLLTYLSTGLKNHPFRVMPFFALYSILAGAAMLEQLLSRFSKRPVVEIGVAVVALALLGQHVVGCSMASFYTYGFHPFPRLPEGMARLLQSPDEPAPYRHLYYAGERSMQWNYPYCLPHSLPTYYELPGMLGYDAIFYRKSLTRSVIERVLKEPGPTLSAYGVRWLLPDPILPVDYLPGHSKAELYVESTLCDGLMTIPLLRYHKIPLPRDTVMHVGEYPKPSPLAFWTHAPAQALPLTMDSEGVRVNLGEVANARTIVVNFLHWPDMRAYVDGQPTPIDHDEWDRMVIQVPEGSKKLAVLFQSPWWPGTAAGGVCMLVALCGLLVLGKEKTAVPVQANACP